MRRSLGELDRELDVRVARRRAALRSLVACCASVLAVLNAQWPL
jgi:hypothetical protein